MEDCILDEPYYWCAASLYETMCTCTATNRDAARVLVEQQLAATRAGLRPLPPPVVPFALTSPPSWATRKVDREYCAWIVGIKLQRHGICGVDAEVSGLGRRR